MKNITIPLYSRIALNHDFPEYNLKRGDIATFIDIIPDPEGIEEGYILEVFNALGESIDVVTVPKSAVSPLQSDDIPRVRSLSQLPHSKQPKSIKRHRHIILLRRSQTTPKIKNLVPKPFHE